VGRRDSAATSPTCLFSKLLLNRAFTCYIAGVRGLSSSWHSEHKVFFVAFFRKFSLSLLLAYLPYLLTLFTYLLNYLLIYLHIYFHTYLLTYLLTYSMQQSPT